MTKQLPGQLSLLTPPRPTPAPTPTAKRKRSPRVTWIGPATCRSCDSQLFIYRMDHRYWAWDHTELVPDCPTCGVAITTTTFDLRKAAA